MYRPSRLSTEKPVEIEVPSAGESISYSFSQVVLTYFINMLGMKRWLLVPMWCEYSDVRLFVLLLPWHKAEPSVLVIW